MVALTEQGRQRVLEFLKDEYHPSQRHFEVVDDSPPPAAELAIVHARDPEDSAVGINAVDLVRFLKG